MSAQEALEKASRGVAEEPRGFINLYGLRLDRHRQGYTLNDSRWLPGFVLFLLIMAVIIFGLRVRIAAQQRESEEILNRSEQLLNEVSLRIDVLQSSLPGGGS